MQHKYFELGHTVSGEGWIFERGAIEVLGGGVYNARHTQIITIPYSSRARHAEGRQIEKANGSQGDAVWSNLVQEAWYWRERWEGEKPVILSIKEGRYRFTSEWGSTFITQRTGAQLRKWRRSRRPLGCIKMTVP